MRVEEQKATILDELDVMDVSGRIEQCGRICYKSEGKITLDSHREFCRKVMTNGHNSVLEMAVVSLRVVIDDDEILNNFYSLPLKYIQADEIDLNALLVSGSIRAFRELLPAFIEDPVVYAMLAYLSVRYPLLFDDKGIVSDAIQDNISVSKMPLAAIERLPPRVVARHRYVAVKLKTNRAVTHEIVRHRPCSFLQESQRYCRYDKEQFGGEVTFIKPVFYQEGSPEYATWRNSIEASERAYMKLLETSSPQAARTVLPNSCKTEIIVFANLEEWRHIFNLRTSPAADPSMRALMIPLHEEFVCRWPKTMEVSFNA